MRLDMQIQVGIYGYGAWPLAILILFLALPFVWQKTKSWTYLLLSACFGYYIIFALDKVFFPLPISGNYADSLRSYNALWVDNLNLIPFHFGRFGTFESTAETMFLNILLTLPFGFGLNFLVHSRAKHFLWIAPALGIGLEATQLAISYLLGFVYRVIDVNDVLMNMLGVWIGYALFRVFIWIYLWLVRALKIRLAGSFEYIYEVALRVQGNKNAPKQGHSLD
jgi:glycopeptide antibiotics resistance protein